MGQAQVHVLNSRIAPIFYTGLVAQPSTGKTGAMRFIAAAVENVERYFDVPLERSCQVNAPTIEGFLDIMRVVPEINGNCYVLFLLKNSAN